MLIYTITKYLDTENASVITIQHDLQPANFRIQFSFTTRTQIQDSPRPSSQATYSSQLHLSYRFTLGLLTPGSPVSHTPDPPGSWPSSRSAVGTTTR